jgi:two-component system, chemotaxis family, CheB/CheR fusion protein
MPRTSKGGGSKKPQRSKLRPVKSAVKESAPVETDSNTGAKPASFPIVGIGGSAGALEALVQLLGVLAPNTGMGFVFIQHLDPTHESMLADILKRSSKIPVHEARDRMPVLPDHLYLVTPNKDLMIANGVLRVMPRSEPPALHMPIDHFFRSLAEDLGPQSIGVVLSGTGTDGAHGVLAIKAAGGITFAQDPDSAKYDGMPRAAISGDEMDFVLPPERIAHELNRIRARRRPAPAQATPAEEVTGRDEEDLRHILGAVQAVSGIDLGFFKQTNILRRVHRRMLLNNLTGLDQYRKLLRENSDEAMALQHDILISVTSFFRDGASVDGLAKVAFPTILKNRGTDQAIRIWVPGCATGEEAYSIAIAVTEFLDARSGNIPVQIFATDISEVAIERARAGVYPPNVVADVAPSRLRRFFVKLDNGYQVNKSIRERCVFARHNLIADPPFSQLDLVSCRNVLIYFRPEYQRRAIDSFYYALKSSGFLTLGRSESVGAFGNMFASVDNRSRIYVKRPNALRAGAPPIGPSNPHFPGVAFHGRASAQSSNLPGGLDLVQKEADRLVMERYAPPGLVINEDLEVIQFRGRTGAILEPAPGLATLNLIKMAREDLRLALQGALYEARKRGTLVRKEGLEIKHDGRTRRMKLEVTPLKIPDSPTQYYLVLFDEDGVTRPPKPEPRPAKYKTSRQSMSAGQIEELQKELADSRSQTQAIIEELEATNEEMKAANEEVLSSNEELQSMNEELETAKEELQSANEELTTLNEELQNRNNELAQVAADLTNLLASVGLPIIMLSRDLRIRRYTPMATKVLNIIPSDAGRPISDINLNINMPDLENLVVDAMESMSVREREVQDRSGHSYSLRIQPFRTLDNHIDGVVIILIDIDALRPESRAARLAGDSVHNIIDALPDALMVLDDNFRLQTANRAFYDTFRCKPQDVVDRPLRDLNHGMWDQAAVSSLLSAAFARKADTERPEVTLEIPGGEKRRFRLNARLVAAEDGSRPLVLLAIESVSSN